MKKILSVILLFILSGSILNAQEDEPIFDVGLWGGLNYNIHNGGFSDFPEYPGCCGLYESGDGFGFSIGALFDYNLNRNFLLTARIGWRSLGGELITSEVIGNTEIRDVNNQTVSITDAIAEYSITGNLNVVSFEPGVIYKLNSNIGFTGGLDISYFMNKTFDRKEEIKSPNNIVYEGTGTRIRNEVIDAEIPQSNSMQFGIFVGAFYDILLQKSVVLSPEIRFYQPFTEVRPDWSISSLYLGVALKKEFYPPLPVEEREIYLRDTTVKYIVGLDRVYIDKLSSDRTVSESKSENKTLRIITIKEQYEKKVPREAELFADVKLTGISEEGEKIDNPKLIIEEFEVEESFPVLPYVYFDEGSADLEKSSMELINSGQTNQFTEANLDWNTIEIYSHILDIIASRMKRNPTSKITVTGTNNNSGVEKNNLELSQNRAQVVKDYLVNTWEIDANRISTEARNLPEKPANVEREDGLIENQRVEISSDNWELMKPVYLSTIEKYANPPQVEITPIVRTDAGIKNWNIDVYEEGTGLREYNGNGIPDPIIWEVGEDPIPRDERKVNVKMNVTDKFNQTDEVNKDLAIEQLTIKKKRFEMIEDKQIQRFSLIVFDYDKAELTRNHKRILDEIKENFKPNSNVKVYGYADRTGERSYNKQLSQRRANEVAKYLGISLPSNNVVGIGNDEILYNNNLPQGRAYSRTVKIIIETPVN
jgi:outer membrane protein OmpA-like peptidoglycan-associated protein